MYMGNERLQQLFRFFSVKILATVLCLGSVGGMARAENPLFQPIVDQNLAAIEYLIRQGIDVNQANEYGLTPLEFAIRSKSVASAQLLFRYGASFDLIDPAVINEFRFKPGIGPFVDQYSQTTSRIPATTAVAPRSIIPPNSPPALSNRPVVTGQAITRPVVARPVVTTQPAIRQAVNRQTSQNQVEQTRTTSPVANSLTTPQLPQQTITVSPTNRSQPLAQNIRPTDNTITVSSSSFLASSSIQNARNSLTGMLPQTTIGVARATTPQTQLRTATDRNLNGVLENVLEDLETSPITVNHLPSNSTITVSPSSTTSVQQAAIQNVPNNNQILALRQSSEAENLPAISATPQETVAVLPAPTKPQEVVAPVVTPQTNPQEKSSQVHFDNPSQACRVHNYNLVVSFTFDDGESSDLDVIQEVFAPRQATGTLGIILNRVDTDNNRYMETSDLRKLYNSGWEIASHTIDHDDLTSLDVQELDNDLLKSHQGLQALGFDVSSLVYPYGANNSLVRDHTSKYYYGAFEGGYRLNTRHSNPFKLKRFHIAEAHDFNYYKRVTDSYSKQHGWLVWAVHTNLNFGQEQVDDLHQLLDYMCDQGIRVVTAREGLDHLNLVDYE